MQGNRPAEAGTRKSMLGKLDEVFVTPDLYPGNFDLRGNNGIDIAASSAYVARMSRTG